MKISVKSFLGDDNTHHDQPCRHLSSDPIINQDNHNFDQYDFMMMMMMIMKMMIMMIMMIMMMISELRRQSSRRQQF